MMIHALPAMGTDRRLYAHEAWRQLKHFTAHDWPRYRGEMTMGALAERVLEVHPIRDEDIVIGSSLGGMVAIEMAKRVRLRALILLGSATHPREMNSFSLWLAQRASRVPVRGPQRLLQWFPHPLLQMFAEADPDFLYGTARAITTWPGVMQVPTSCYRLHGRFDFIIAQPEQVNAYVNSIHLIAYFAPRTCVAKIKAWLALGKEGTDTISHEATGWR